MKHNCAIAFLSSSEPSLYLNSLIYSLFLQKNRGQDTAGIFLLNKNKFKLITTNEKPLIDNLLQKIDTKQPNNVLLAHLRYATYGNNLTPQPAVMKNIFLTKSIAIAGNFNITNLETIIDFLKQKNIFVPNNNDVEILLYLFSYFIDKYADHNSWNANKWIHKIYNLISGGFFLVITNAKGETILLRDKYGIRPAFYYYDNNKFIATSEKYALAEAFNVNYGNIREIPNGSAIIIRNFTEFSVIKIQNFKPKYCSLEKIYFSSPNNKEVYSSRLCLGSMLFNKIKHFDWNKTVLCYVPNSATTAFKGLVNKVYNETGNYPKTFPIIAKNKDVRTFISNKRTRTQITKNIYSVFNIDLTGKVLICVEDSIIRGNTIKNLIPKLLKLNPEKIVFVSSAPMFKYPDFYGIDIATVEELIAFQSLMINVKRDFPELLEKLEEMLSQNMNKNILQKIYSLFSDEALVRTIEELLAGDNKNKISIIYNDTEVIPRCLGENYGTWYFDGNYPTEDGVILLNKALLNYLRGDKSRAYELTT